MDTSVLSIQRDMISIEDAYKEGYVWMNAGLDCKKRQRRTYIHERDTEGKLLVRLAMWKQSVSHGCCICLFSED